MLKMLMNFKANNVIKSLGQSMHRLRVVKCNGTQIYQSFSGTVDVNLSGYDQSQIDQLDDKCILVDKEDTIVGSSRKIECHLAKNRSHVSEKSPGGLLHRAFSVFLFNSKNELLLQQRSKHKITFPEYYTNTCCSHPRATDLEMNEKGHIGIKLAAQRRMNFELGIPLEQIPVGDFHPVTRILYNSPAGEIWAENELDHILVIKKDTDLSINTKEVSSVQFVNEAALNEFMANAEDEEYKITPWFKFIYRSFLQKIWKAVNAGEKLSEIIDNQIWKAGDIY